MSTLSLKRRGEGEDFSAVETLTRPADTLSLRFAIAPLNLLRKFTSYAGKPISGGLLRSSSVTYLFKYAPSSRLCPSIGEEVPLP